MRPVPISPQPFCFPAIAPLPIPYSPFPIPRRSGALGRPRIELLLAHARDLHLREESALLERVAVHERLRFRAAADIDDEETADVVLAVVAQRRAGQHQDLLLAVEVIDMRLQSLFALRREIGTGNAGNGPKHYVLLSTFAFRLLFSTGSPTRSGRCRRIPSRVRSRQGTASRA